MHEASITESILSLALDKARESCAQKVTRINLVLGAMSGVEGECVRMYLEVIGQNTAAEGAVLSFESRPTVLKCRKCDKEFTPEEFSWECPDCHEADVEIISGRECYMESIEVE